MKLHPLFNLALCGLLFSLSGSVASAQWVAGNMTYVTIPTPAPTGTGYKATISSGNSGYIEAGASGPAAGSAEVKVRFSRTYTWQGAPGASNTLFIAATGKLTGDYTDGKPIPNGENEVTISNTYFASFATHGNHYSPSVTISPYVIYFAGSAGGSVTVSARTKYAQATAPDPYTGKCGVEVTYSP